MLLVYRCTPPQDAADVWASVRAAVDEADLETAVRSFEAARAARLRGFFGQDVRRVLYAIAKRAVARAPALQARLFPRARAHGPRLGYAPTGTTSALMGYSGAEELLPPDWAYDAQGRERPWPSAVAAGAGTLAAGTAPGGEEEDHTARSMQRSGFASAARGGGSAKSGRSSLGRAFWEVAAAGTVCR